jgi:hypothetical protein
MGLLLYTIMASVWDGGPCGYTDADGDGYYAEIDDCNDSNPNIHPGALEVCDGVDNDCDDQIDEGFVMNTYYRDADHDGYGDPSHTIVDCAMPYGYVSNSADCNDGNAAIHPGALELCNRMDDDCDGYIDEEAEGCILYYLDEDSDGYGEEADSRCLCEMDPPFSAIFPGDCDDTDPEINPGATEVCNGVDDNCDGRIDEGCNPCLNDPCGPNAYCTDLGGGAYSCTCEDGWSNCNGFWTDGCETNTNSDINNCGDCGVVCGPGYKCVNGHCVPI